MSDELQALQAADFGWVQSLDSVWSDEARLDAGPNQDLVEHLVAELARLTVAPNPPARAFVGQAGIGKTHLMGVLRRRAWAARCWFVMLDVVGITDFWKSAALSFVTSLLQAMPDGQRQYEAVIAGVARRFKVAAVGPAGEPSAGIDPLLGALMEADLPNALRHRDVFRALALLGARDLATKGAAHAWLQGFDVDEASRKGLGFASAPPAPVEIVTGLLWVMGLAGPTLIAVDQIDGVIAARAGGGNDFGEASDFTALLSGGLLDLSRKTGRGMLAMTCLLSSWEIIRDFGPSSLPQSFGPPVALRLARSGSFVRALIADRMAPANAGAGVDPRSPTWPFTDAAILSASAGMTPRTILMRCDEHRRRCLAAGEVVECDALDGKPTPPDPPPGPDDLDAVYDAAVAAADLDGLLDDRDDGKLGALLRDAFDLYAKQIEPHDDHDVVSRADPAQRTPPLHGRLAFIDHRANDHERHVCFRALQHGNAIALGARFRAALTASGIAARLPGRKLVIVRRGPPPGGPKTRELFDAFRAAGGIEVDPSDADLRCLVALRDMRDAALAASEFDLFERWLLARKPLCDTALFGAAGLCPPPLPPWDGAARPAAKEPARGGGEDAPPAPPSAGPPPAAASPATIPVGRRAAGGDAVELPASLLPRHTAIIAGAGSGKTVLLRRMVEEAALAGIPAIVIDPNNDLSRLGDPWPERPAAFTDEDAAKAARYARDVEVVVWTPGIHAGNPLFLSVLPDFAALGDDPDERAQAVTMAADTLGPLAGAKTDLAKGVLADALRAFADRGGGDLKAMTALLADLPEGASEIDKADAIATRLANGLRAAVATNPLLKATGPVLDPALLFHGRDPARTRVSVVNLSGLASDEARQDFVNRLQMTLFGWVKRHPSPRGLLYVIDEAQLFIPSGAGALSRTSGVQLVAQARKYGLGMVAVTQAPKGIDNKVVSNCTTQFLGKQNSPTDQQSVKAMVAATGGAADDVGRLAAGEFYFKTEKSGKPFKLRTPICLSHHPANPPTPEEVVARAKRSAAAG